MSRFSMTRYIPQGATEIQHPRGLAVAYAYESERNGRVIPLAIAYRGKSAKSCWHHSFATAEQRERKIAELFSSVDGHEALKAEQAAKRKQPHTLKVGDIVVNSWGWEQTNVDFYEVVKISANFVELREIGSATEPGSEVSHGMADRVVADPEHKGSEITRHRADSNGHVNFKHGSGGKWDGRAMYRSWYA